ncbi:MAG: cellulase family glycosylhydrolase [Oscillospiraceae bacterium]|jgi:hypothetical protein|nr:cellulase family glycosylhydrolase [Oscillospiraceae bacterium]
MKHVKKALAMVLTLAILLALVPAAAPVAQAAFTPITGWEMMEKLGVGYTFGNTTEARGWPEGHPIASNPDDTETCWGQPLIEQWHFQSIAMKGFDSYRMCVSWEPHLDKDYNIDPAWLDRIQQLVDWALDAGLYVLLNTHHEQELYWRIKDGRYEEAKTLLTAIWSQVAERFKDYPETLLFEIMNEPMLLEYYQGPGHWLGSNAQETQALSDTVSKLNADALDVIRKSGGNNDRRVLMLCLPGAHADSIPYMETPDDLYIVYGAFGGGGYFINDENLIYIQNLLDNGIGFVNKESNLQNYGEEGTIPSLSEAINSTSEHYGRFAKMGIPSFWFSFCASREENPDDVMNSFLNRLTGEWINTQVLEALFAAYGKTLGPDYVYVPPPPDLPYELTGPYTEKQFTFWTPPAREFTAAEKMVVEYEGASLGGYSFARYDPSPWAQYNSYDDSGKARITEEPGKITFDLRGLEGETIGFAAWDMDAEKIKRVYIEGSEAPNLDSASGWARDGIQSAYAKGVIPEDIQNNYQNVITRAEFCRMAVRWLEFRLRKGIDTIVAERGIPERMGHTFSDTTNTDILAAYRLGVTGGEVAPTDAAPGRFNPSGQFNREQAAMMILNTVKVAGMDVSNTSSAGFNDIGTASSWAVNAINYVRNAGIMSGTGTADNPLFSPQRLYTRQESIVTFNNIKL